MVDKKALGIIEGRIVHYVLISGAERPALILNAWRDDGGYFDGEVNLLVFLDGTNDLDELSYQPRSYANFQVWATSVPMDNGKKVHTWHFPEKD